LLWQRDELAMFLHFGVNTFTDREWGDGREDPAIFNPSSLDARQWARTARAAGFRSVILTAKHHDGFCLWPTRTTEHSVAKSPFRGGTGDVVREMVDACRAEGLRPGLYLSPWDRNNAAYGNSALYNDLYSDQLTELLTQYGPLAEVWFDGANGEGPNGKKQVYDWPRTFAIVRRHQPNCRHLLRRRPDVRWCGNENGSAGDPNWSSVDPSIVTYPGASGQGIIDALQHGQPTGSVWRPAECDTSIRPGWFYHPADDAKVAPRTTSVDLYHLSVGRNAKLASQRASDPRRPSARDRTSLALPPSPRS
jgi:alpha-L-fucosidase